jgi:hypothetical protein
MGFNKRYVTKESTLKHLYSNTLSTLYDKVDSFIFLDDFSSKVREMYSKGLSNEEIIVNIEELNKK